jgi:hypothetical protein
MSYSSTILAESGLVLYARLGEASGTNATDSSTNSNTGTYVNTPTLGTAGLLSGDPDTAVTFAAGSSQCVTFPHIAALNVGDNVTFECWVKHTMAVTGGMISLGNTAGAAGLYIRNSGSAGHIEVLKSNTSSICSSTIAQNDGNIHHIMVAKSSTPTTKIFIDGVDVTNTVTNATLGNSTETIHVGSDISNSVGADFFTGVIDEAAIYNVAKTVTTAQAHYQAGIVQLSRSIRSMQAVKRSVFF